MANLNTDPLERMIASGRYTPRPIEHYGIPDVLTIDLDVLANTLVTRINTIYQSELNVRNQYNGNSAVVTQQILNDVTAMVDYAVGQTYNKLRSLLDKKIPHLRPTRMNTRCPVYAGQEFPTWLSSTLSSIGPLRITDGASDRLVVYASSAATMQNYGRTNPVVFNEGNYSRLMAALRHMPVAMTPFNHAGESGSFFPTITPIRRNYVWSLFGQTHSSHYENEDGVRVALCTSDIGNTPFTDIGMTIGYVNDETTLAALAAVAAPDDIPIGQDANSAGRPVSVEFNVNYYGIKPAVAAQGSTRAVPRGMYVVGRGTQRYYQCILADQISTTEILELLRYRFTR